MPFPESRRVVFKQNPLSEVLCQLRFPTILEIGVEDPAAYQNKVRGAYPLYSKGDGDQLIPKEVSELLDQLRMAPPLTTRTTHKFLTEDGSRFLSLTADFLALTEKNYIRWEQFEAELSSVKAGFEEVYQPAFYSRIGLRYRNIIDREALGLSVPWDQLVNPAIIGLLGAKELRDEVPEMRSESLISIGDDPRSFIRLRQGLTLSPDGHQVYVIDADCYTSERRETDGIFTVLDRFRRANGDLFRWTITQLLWDALEPDDLGSH